MFSLRLLYTVLLCILATTAFARFEGEIQNLLDKLTATLRLAYQVLSQLHRQAYHHTVFRVSRGVFREGSKVC
jgi:hypothetical protein